MPDTQNMTPAEVETMRTKLHGFFTLWDFFKAAVAMTVTMLPVFSLVSAGVVNYMDGRYDNRYAPKDIEPEVVENSAIARRGLKVIMRLEMRDVTRELCSAEVKGSQRYRANEDKQQLTNDYRKLFGEEIFVPNCEDVAR